MFLKKDKKFLNKNILRFIKQPNGSIAIIVLIIGIAIVLAVSALSAYMIKDIRFTQIDEQKLKALNIAEAGISNMFLNIDKYLNKEINALPSDDSLPPNSYKGSVISNGIEVGSYLVNYTTPETESNLMPTYTIISKGTEKNGQQRTVKVTIVIASQYDFIFSFDTVNGNGKITSNTNIIGPFMTNGSIDLRGNGGLFEGNPLIINGNLTTGGNSSIGSIDKPVDLYLGGICDKTLTSGYADNNIYLSNFYSQKINIQSIVIDDSYIDSIVKNGAAKVEDDLTIKDNGSFSTAILNQDSSNYLKFTSDKSTLQISGNIVVSGDIDIGSGGTIKYEGKGNLIATGNIDINSKLIPKNMNSFPLNSLMVLIAKNDIDFDIGNSSGGDFYNPDAAVVGICNDTIYIPNNKYIRGNLIGKKLYIGNNSTIYFEPGISDMMPSGRPLAGYFLLSKKWEEIPNS
ncbi:MAG: hypothetical protein ACYC0D_02760 [Candidatus Humimicrobiaceae bacterium]